MTYARLFHPPTMSTPSTNPILIVEDDKKTSSLIRVYLEREGFTTLAAYDGQQALTLAERHQPLFIILDLWKGDCLGWIHKQKAVYSSV